MLSMPSRSAVPGATISSALTIRDGPRLAGQPELAEARERTIAAPRGERRSLRCAGDRERDRKIRARLVDAHSAYHVDEHVSGAEADAGVATEDREDERQPV